MAIDRRTFLGGAAALFAMPAGALANGRTPSRGRSLPHPARTRWARTTRWCSASIAASSPPCRFPIAAMISPCRPVARECVVFARRPGNFAAIFDPAGGAAARFITTRADRHFYGHGAYSDRWQAALCHGERFRQQPGRDRHPRRDGRLSLDRRVRHRRHRPARSGDPVRRRTLVVANGGIDTAPETGRAMLNLADMRPSLAYVDLRDRRASGTARSRRGPGAAFDPPSGRRARRHGDFRLPVRRPQDRAAAACRLPPARRGAATGQRRRHRSCARCATISARSAVDRTGTIAATSAPRGGIVVYWDVGARRYLGETRLADACGLSPDAAGPAIPADQRHGRHAPRTGGPVLCPTGKPRRRCKPMPGTIMRCCLSLRHDRAAIPWTMTQRRSNRSRMLRSLYNWTMSFAGRPNAKWVLAAVSFAESSFFPIPPDVLLVPMVLANREKAWQLAGICTVASVLGGMLGYAIGALLYDTVGLLADEPLRLYRQGRAVPPILCRMGRLDHPDQGPDADPL